MTDFVVQTTIDETVYDVTVGTGPGPAGTVAVGTVSTGAAGSSAAVTNVGTPTAAVLDFTIPQGEPGDVTGPASSTDGHLAVWNNTAGTLLADGGAPFSGAYADLTGKPTIPTTAGQVGALAVANDLSDVQSAASALVNLGIPAPSGNAGKVLTVNSGGTGFELDTPAPTLSSLAGSLGSNVTVGTSLTTVLTTGTLTVGTWLLTFGATIGPASSNGMDVQVAVASGTATLTGQQSATAASVAASGSITLTTPVALTCVVTVTAAATLTLSAQASAGTGTVYAASTDESFAGATGWTAIKIA